MRCLVAAIVSLLLVCNANSRGGGHNQTFDPNSYGGGWKNIKTDYGASCSGPTGQSADVTALNAWNAFVSSNSPAQSKLYIPPGSDCWFNNGTFLSGANNNLVIWGYGATVHDMNFTGLFTYGDAAHDALLSATANIGDTTATVTSATGLTSSAWAIFMGLCFQNNGFPQNCHFWDYVYITSIVGTTVTFSPPLKNQYLTTWPDLGSGCGGAQCGGPGRLYMIQPTWAMNAQVFGLTFRRDGALITNGCNGSGSEITIVGENITFTDAYFDTNACDDIGTGATLGTNYFFSYVGGAEIDKEIDSLTFYRSSGKLLNNQSSSANVNSVSSSWSGLNGLAKNTALTNSKFGPFAHMGPWGYGHAINVTSDGTVIPSGVPAASIHSNNVSWFTYSNGTLSIALTDPNIANVYALWVPGQAYYFGANDCSDVSSPHSSFTANSVTTSGGNFVVNTSMGAIEPTPTCFGSSCPLFCAYPSATVTQTNLPSGSADLTPFAAH